MPISEAKAVELVTRMAQELRLRQVDVDKWNALYDGKHRLVFASDVWQKQHADRYQDFADNWCAVVANSPAERLALTGIRLPDEPQTDAELWKIWQVNAGDAESSAGFIDLNVASRTFVLVWGDPVEITWESASEMIVAYEPGSHRKRTAALKVWREDNHTEHATLYLADEVWKFRRLTNATDLDIPGKDALRWRPRELPEEPNPQPNPMGEVPVVEIPNRPRLDGTTISEVAGVGSMQHSINLLWAYLFTTADFASYPQRVVMGQAPPKVPILDADGQKIGEREVPLERFGQDRVVWLTGQNTKIDSWEAADLQQFTDIIEVQVGHVAAQTRTPQHYLIGKMANLAAETLVQNETGLVKKVEEQQTFAGPRIQEVFRLVALAQGDEKKADAILWSKVVWRDAEARSDHQMADKIIKLKQAGFPFRWLVEEYGVAPTEVDRIMELRREELEQASRADVMAIMGGSRDVPGEEPGDVE